MRALLSKPARAQAALGIISTMTTHFHEGGIYVHPSFGRVVDRLANHFDKVYVTVPVTHDPPPASKNHRLVATHVEVIAQPYYGSLRASLRYLPQIVVAYARICRRARVLFVRDMCPYLPLFYAIAWMQRCRIVHWIVGDAMAIVRSSPRNGWFIDALSVAYAWQDRLFARLGRRLTGGSFICCGRALGDLFHSPRTVVTASGTVTKDEFFERDDTCQGSVMRILFIGILRPEKGVEHLIEAAGRLKTERPWELVIVGSSDRFGAYQDRLNRLVDRLGMADRVRWEGYVPYGPRMLQCLRESDLFVLPSLSEGTPHVLVEARANSLPVVASNVGGIPSSVTDGVDGLLVPARDPDRLARAIDRVLSDSDLRRSLIRAGLRSARGMTVERFAETVLDMLREPRQAVETSKHQNAAMPKPRGRLLPEGRKPTADR